MKKINTYYFFLIQWILAFGLSAIAQGAPLCANLFFTPLSEFYGHHLQTGRILFDGHFDRVIKIVGTHKVLELPGITGAGKTALLRKLESHFKSRGDLIISFEVAAMSSLITSDPAYLLARMATRAQVPREVTQAMADSKDFLKAWQQLRDFSVAHQRELVLILDEASPLIFGSEALQDFHRKLIRNPLSKVIISSTASYGGHGIDEATAVLKDLILKIRHENQGLDTKIYEVGPEDLASFERVIAELSKQTGLHFTPAATMKLFEKSQGWPRIFTRLMAIIAETDYHAGDSITEEIVLLAAKEFKSNFKYEYEAQFLK